MKVIRDNETVDGDDNKNENSGIGFLELIGIRICRFKGVEEKCWLNLSQAT